MIEKLIANFMSRPAFAQVARQEFERLQEGGYLDQQELERLAQELQARLGERAEQAKGVVQPLVLGLGRTLREALDIPSRQEIVELTAALRAAQERAADADPQA